MQRTMPGTSGSVGMDGGWRLSTTTMTAGAAAAGGRDCYYFMVSDIVGGGSKDENLIPTYLNIFPV